MGADVIWEQVTCLARLASERGVVLSLTPEFSGGWTIEWEEAILGKEDELDQQCEDDRTKGEDSELEHHDVLFQFGDVPLQLRLHVGDVLFGCKILGDGDGASSSPGAGLGCSGFDQRFVNSATMMLIR